jgi:hypothetical protein
MRKEKEEKAEKEKKAEKQKMDDAMRKHLAESGFTQSQIEAIMDKNKKQQQQQQQQPASHRTTTTTTTTLARVPLREEVPVYAKIHVDYISTETLRYYDIPWEYDRVRYSTSNPFSQTTPH